MFVNSVNEGKFFFIQMLILLSMKEFFFIQTIVNSSVDE